MRSQFHLDLVRERLSPIFFGWNEGKFREFHYDINYFLELNHVTSICSRFHVDLSMSNLNSAAGIGHSFQNRSVRQKANWYPTETCFCLRPKESNPAWTSTGKEIDLRIRRYPLKHVWRHGEGVLEGLVSIACSVFSCWSRDVGLEIVGVRPKKFIDPYAADLFGPGSC